MALSWIDARAQPVVKTFRWEGRQTTIYDAAGARKQ
jgi:hypothetical protein